MGCSSSPSTTPHVRLPVSFVPAGAKVMRQCREAARTLGYAVPCPTRIPRGLVGTPFGIPTRGGGFKAQPGCQPRFPIVGLSPCWPSPAEQKNWIFGSSQINVRVSTSSSAAVRGRSRLRQGVGCSRPGPCQAGQSRRLDHAARLAGSLGLCPPSRQREHLLGPRRPRLDDRRAHLRSRLPRLEPPRRHEGDGSRTRSAHPTRGAVRPASGDIPARWPTPPFLALPPTRGRSSRFAGSIARRGISVCFATRDAQDEEG